MRPLPVILLVVASFLAGCTGGGGDTPPGEPPGEDRPPIDPPVDPDPEESETEEFLLTQFTMEGCSGNRFHAFVDVATAQELVAEGYTPMTSGSPTSPIPGEQVQRASLRVDLYNCTSFTAGQFEFEDVWFGMAYVLVDPPADARVATDVHAYTVEMIAAEDVLSAVWPIAGYPMHNGTAGTQDMDISRGTVAGDYAIDVTTIAPDSQGVTGSISWYHELDNGDRLTWVGDRDIPGGDGGGGLLSVPQDSLVRPATRDDGSLEGEGAAIDAASFTGMDLIKELADGRQ